MRNFKIIICILIYTLPGGTSLFSGNRYNNKDDNLDIFFASKRDGYYGVYRSDSKNTQNIFTSCDILKRFPNMAKYQIAYSVSQDRRYVAFNALSESLDMDIFLHDLDTGKTQNLTQDLDTDTLPVLSHDGKWIAYLSHVKGGRNYDIVSVISTDGLIKRRLTKNYTKIATPSFSPDDREILYVRYRPYHSAISIVDIETGWIQQLTSFSCSNQSPAFSTDGTKIVYASDCNGTFDIWMMNRDGSNNRLLYQSPGLEYDPHFTIDGKRVFFVSDWVAEKKEGKIGSAIISVNIDGDDPVNLLPKKYIQKDFFCFYPRSVGNGKALSFQGKVVKRFKSTQYSVYILDLENGNVRKIVNDEFNNTEPNVFIK
ncbi:MAG: PD40 domain-containing protein [Spirochaetota bacterium]|nr:MAG: PD40 domain-containing protein [Spirochaetota bacterium]